MDRICVGVPAGEVKSLEFIYIQNYCLLYFQYLCFLSTLIKLSFCLTIRDADNMQEVSLTISRQHTELFISGFYCLSVFITLLF